MTAKLLLVDDDAEILSVQRRILERESLAVDTTQDASEALSMTKANNYDLIITDLIMPNFDGIELILSLRRSSTPPKVIATSGGCRSGSLCSLRAARLCGATEVLSKPFSRDDLLTAVNYALNTEDEATNRPC